MIRRPTWYETDINPYAVSDGRFAVLIGHRPTGYEVHPSERDQYIRLAVDDAVRMGVSPPRV